jgi:hypothetical protein
MRVDPDAPDSPPDTRSLRAHRAKAAPPPLTRKQDTALSAMLILQCAMLFVAAPLAALDYAVPRRSVELLVLAYVSLVVMIARRRTTAAVAIGGSACGLASTTWGLVDSPGALAFLMDIGSLIGIVFSGGIVARALFAPGPVTIHRVVGAVVLYLNAALGFSMAYRLIRDVVPDAFAGASIEASNLQSMVGMIYFSFVTLTSTGFGDIVPVHPIARSVANLEAVIGQLYPATLVAVLVSQHLETRRR